MATSHKLHTILLRFADEIIEAAREELLESLRLKPAQSKRADLATDLPKGVKRSPEALQELEAQLHQCIKKNPGLRIEQIGLKMGVPTKTLNLPTKKLIAGKLITTKGVKRATRYFPRAGK